MNRKVRINRNSSLFPKPFIGVRWGSLYFYILFPSDRKGTYFEVMRNSATMIKGVPQNIEKATAEDMGSERDNRDIGDRSTQPLGVNEIRQLKAEGQYVNRS